MSVLKLGCKGWSVSALQRQLRDLGYMIEVDGDFGPKTATAVRAFQSARGLVADGVAGPKTLKVLRGGDCDKLLSEADLTAAANRLGVPLAAICAVNEVESRGEGFFATDRPAILFERHIMRRRLSVHKQRLAGWPTDLVSDKTGGYVGGMAEYRRLERACQIHETSALESCSWGAYQIMGYHWQDLGYESVQDFVAQMQTGEAAHLDAFVRFIEANPPLLTALRQLDWEAFAKGYNGPAYRSHGYHTKLAAAYERHMEAA